jgi:hypothetical protein
MLKIYKAYHIKCITLKTCKSTIVVMKPTPTIVLFVCLILSCTHNKFIPKYDCDSITKESLLNLSDKSLTWELSDYIDNCLVKGDYSKEREIILRLSPPLRVSYISIRLEMEVNNGGFSQYFFNSAGKFAFEAPESLLIAGASNKAMIAQSALDTVTEKRMSKEEYLQRHSKRELNEESFAEQLEELDNQYFEIEEDLWDVLGSYLRMNLDLITEFE